MVCGEGGLVVEVVMPAVRDIGSLFFLSYCDCFVVVSCLMLDSLAKEMPLSTNTFISHMYSR